MFDADIDNVQVERAGHNTDNNNTVSGSSSSGEGSSLDSSHVGVKNYDADSIDLHLEQAKKKQFIKAHKNKSSYNLTSKRSKADGSQEHVNGNFRYLVRHIEAKLIITFIFRRNSNVTVKSNAEKFTETEITWSENTDRLI